MGITGVITTFAVSTALAAYLFYALVPVPPDIEQRDDVFWIFAKQKYIRTLSIIGEFVGFGHRLEHYRQLSSLSMWNILDPPDYTGIAVNNTVFAGIPVRLYEPLSRVSNGPGLIWLHGGGWVSGSAEKDDFIAAELSRRLGILVVSVNYRLAPEFPFPVPFEDCVTAAVYFLEHAHEMDVDSARIAVAGASAGANLAAAVSLKLRDTGSLRRPVVQVLVVPCLQAFDFNTPSYQYNVNNAFLPSYWMASYWLWYARGADGHRLADVLVNNDHTSVSAKTSEVSWRVDHNLIPRKYIDATYVPNTVDHGDSATWTELEPVFLNPYFAPLMSADLMGLPSTLIMTAERDVLRDDGILYSRRLASAGIFVEHLHYDHGYHLLLVNFQKNKLAETAVSDIVHFLSKRL